MSSVEKAMERLQKARARMSGRAAAGSAPAPVEREAVTPDIDTGSSGQQRAGTPRTMTLDFAHLVRLGFLPNHYETSDQYEEFRRIKRPIISAAFGQSQRHETGFSNLVMITSALPAEGKTFTTINLALNMTAERDTTVLVVDGDFAKRSLSRAFKLDDAPGLTEVLDGKMTISDVLINTDDPKLKVIPAGQPHRNSAELLASRRMADHMAEIAKRYPDRVVLIDAPPYLATNEAEIIEEQVGQVVLVVEAEKTPQPLLHQVIDRVGPNRKIGLILNKRRKLSGLYSDSYDYYGYQAGGYKSHQDSS